MYEDVGQAWYTDRRCQYMNNLYEVRGDVTVIFLNGGHSTLIDIKDLERANEFLGRWYAHWNKNSQSRYVEGGMKIGTRKYKRASLHRWLMNNPIGIVDHANHDTFDNRRSLNLRVVDRSQNGLNRRGAPKSNKTSGIRNVYW